MLRRVVRALVVAALVLAAGAGWLWSRLRPPTLGVPAAGGYSIADVTIVEPGRGRWPHRTIRVEGGRVAGVAASGGEPARSGEKPAGAARRAGDTASAPFAGDFALPGLIDMHVHHPPATPLGDVELFALLFLAHGVTAVRDTGNFDGTIFETRRRIAAGELPGPRIFACGSILDGDPPFWPGSRVVRDAAEGRAAVREAAARHADCVKVYDRVSPEALAGIQDEAAQHRLKVIGHVPHRAQFAEARLADVQHLTGILERGEELTPARVRAVITTSAALGIAHTPTLVLYDRVASLSDWPHRGDDPAAHLLPRYYREILWNPRYDRRLASLSGERWKELEEAPHAAEEIVRRLHEARVEIHVGTDTMNPFVVPGRSMHEEMRLLAAAGLTPEEVWTAATRTAGEFLGEPGLGTVAPGAPADLLLFRDDPTRDLAALDTLDAVVAAGRLYARATLGAALARWREHAADPVFDRVSMLVVERLAPRARP